MSLGPLIAARIKAQGPMRLDDYMRLCLLHPEHGYYTTREPFGAQGDFTTAPEISQMFGELTGAAIGQAWLDQGCPAGAVLAEIGPGRGTLMADALRVLRRIPGWNAEVMLVEASPRLRAIQTARLGRVRHLDSVDDLPADRPLFLIANEFFDALPIRQFQRTPEGWAEVMVSAEGDRLTLALGPPLPLALSRSPDAPPGTIREVCEAGAAIAGAIARRIALCGGAAIWVDYGGWDGQGDTFQALQDGRPADPLAAPGRADLTAHVDFAPLAAAARKAGATASLLEEQGAWLQNLGIRARAGALADARPDQAQAITAALHRLTDAAQMGQLFKALAIWPPDAAPVAGFRPG